MSVDRVVRAMGDVALLVELSSQDEALGLWHTLGRHPAPGQTEIVVGARSVLVRYRPTTDLHVLADHLRTAPTARPDGQPDLVTIETIYDGEDLDDVGVLTGLGRAGVIAAHTGATWTVAFTGFAPGFGYLTARGDPLAVPRRNHPRTEVPAGAVGLAGAFSGIYPRASPGGWQLIGRTMAPLWDLHRDPPALLRPGSRVRFVDIG
jgi:KipI family sensor histidine kinase inhibitor